MNLDELRHRVEKDIAEYSYKPFDGMAGNAWSSARIAEQLDQMKKALVSPYFVQIRMERSVDQIENDIEPQVRSCAVVADPNDGYLLAFDPVESEFLLAQFFKDTIHSIGVRGDAVGCFMAR